MRKSPLNKTRETDLQDEASNSDLSNGDFASEDQTKTYLCVSCGKAFSEPLDLTLHTNGAVETYDACPHCFSRIGVSGNLRKNLRESTEDDEKTTPTICKHSLGYLRTHPKETPYPDECLTCAAIMDCMVGRA